MKVTAVVREKVVVQAAPKETVVFSGGILEADSGEPVSGSTVRAPGCPSTNTPAPAPGYETQKKDVHIQGDQVVILNVDLQPKQGRGVRKANPTKNQQ